ncbi:MULTISPECIES: hypothetical protein [Nitrosomonas]|nr:MULTISPECIES: hypothetical protein [Nitrosomonas]UVS62937.1 hypothetical protein NX761_07515 [Nitrosomonas sp. PLL12]
MQFFRGDLWGIGTTNQHCDSKYQELVKRYEQGRLKEGYSAREV